MRPEDRQRAFDQAFGDHHRYAQPSKGGTRVWQEKVETWESFVARNANDCNFYFLPGVVKPSSLYSRTKGDMDYSDYLWADLDPRGPDAAVVRDNDPGYPGFDQRQERKLMFAALTDFIDGRLVLPTFVIDSGRGMWAFWKLKERYHFDGARGERTLAFEAALRGIAHGLSPWGDNCVININRIARLPGTKNLKTGATARVLRACDRSHALSDFPSLPIVRCKGRAHDVPPIPLDVYTQMLAATPYVGGPDGLDDRHEYKGWLDFAMACHEASGGDPGGGGYLAAFEEWSLSDDSGPHGPNWDGDHIGAHWSSFDCEAAGGITRTSWFKLLTFFGHGDLVSEATVRTDFPDDASDYADGPDQGRYRRREARSRARRTADRTLPPLLAPTKGQRP
jgi:hypothetical protein